MSSRSVLAKISTKDLDATLSQQMERICKTKPCLLFIMNNGNNQYTASVYGLIKNGDYMEAVKILDVCYWVEKF